MRDYLGPALEQAGLGHVKVMIWDHNKERVYDRAKVAFEDQVASKYIWGICFHWYSGDHFEALSAVHDRFPDKKLFFSEGCQEGGVHLGSWNTGERYGHDIIGNLNNWMSSWTDWNIVLDEQGGPNHVGNYCDAPIIGDTKNDEITFLRALSITSGTSVNIFVRVLNVLVSLNIQISLKQQLSATLMALLLLSL